MTKVFSTILILFFFNACAQTDISIQHPYCRDAAFEKEICSYLDFSVTPISPSELKKITKNKVYILDAREPNEFNVSHIRGAKNIGYDKFKIERIKDIPKDATIVIYCSIGYRSEKIGAKMKEAGYNKVYNLFGSIFEWVNQGNEIVDNNNQITHKLHTYNQKWSRWVNSKDIIKIY